MRSVLEGAPPRALQPTFFSALAANLSIEFGSMLPFGRFAALLANAGIECGAFLLLDCFPALLADERVEVGSILSFHCFAAVSCLRRAWLWPSLLVCHWMFTSTIGWVPGLVCQLSTPAVCRSKKRALLPMPAAAGMVQAT